MYGSEDEQLRRRRSRHLRWVVLAIFAVLAVRLFSIQVIQAARYHELSVINRARHVRARAPRGLILDRERRVLAANRPSFILTLPPAEARRHPETIANLAVMAARPDSQLWRALRREHVMVYEPACLLRNLSFELVSQVEEKGHLVPGASIEVEPMRYYPWGDTGAHLLGYLGVVGESDLEGRGGARYRPGDVVGRSGIEKSMEVYLRGRDGERYVEVDALGKELRLLSDPPPKPPREGHRVVLALDMDLQVAAREALDEFGRGAVVALDPRSGDVMALVSTPSFDPNLFAARISPAAWRELNSDPQRPLLNRALAGLYPPGSVFKVAVAAMALEDGTILPGETLRACTGGYRLGNRVFHCWKPEGHGALNVRQALAQSCDVFFYQLGERLALAGMSRYARQWRLGEVTGVDCPGEQRCLFPDSLWMDNRYGVGGWTRAVALNLAIGQGEILVTPLKLATFMAAIANGGRLLTPRTWLRVETPDGRVMKENQVESMELGISDSTLEAVRRGLVLAVTEGTARGAGLPQVAVAGKTGTAQNPHGDDHAWFVGYAPAEDPEIVVLALVEGGGHGSDAAVPVVRQVLAAYFGNVQRRGI